MAKEKKCSRSFSFCEDEVITKDEVLGKVYPDMEETKECKECGKVHGSLFFMSQHIGNASSKDGSEYELMTSMQGNPIIRNIKTNRQFVLGWSEILTMAKKRGIDGGKFSNQED